MHTKKSVLRGDVSMHNIKAVVFDWGNTLVDYPLQHRSDQIILLKEFLKTVNAQVSSNALSDYLANTLVDAELQRFGKESAEYTVIPFASRVQRFWRPFLPSLSIAQLEQMLCTHIFACATRFADALPTIHALKRARYKIGILSNTPWGTTPLLWREELERHGFYQNVYDAAIFCGDIGYRKPHPAVFSACLHQLSVSADEAVVVGDSLASDMLGAKNIGCIPIWLQREASRDMKFDGIIINDLCSLIEIL